MTYAHGLLEALSPCFCISLEQHGLCRHVQNYADTRPGKHVIEYMDFEVSTKNDPVCKLDIRLISGMYVQV